MGEPERRRRRLRAHSRRAAAAEDGRAATTEVGTEPSAATPETPERTAATGFEEPGGVAPAPPLPQAPPPRPVRARPTSGAGVRARPTSGAGTNGDESERGLRGLVGSGSSQVSVSAALRARDAARPTEAYVADAEANLTIVRRNWMPREELPRVR